MIVRNLSWPAVSQICGSDEECESKTFPFIAKSRRDYSTCTTSRNIRLKNLHESLRSGRTRWALMVLTCNLIFFPSTSIVLILKSIPIVVMNVGLKESFAYRSSKQVLPTPAECVQKMKCQSKKWRAFVSCPPCGLRSLLAAARVTACQCRAVNACPRGVRSGLQRLRDIVVQTTVSYCQKPELHVIAFFPRCHFRRSVGKTDKIVYAASKD